MFSWLSDLVKTGPSKTPLADRGENVAAKFLRNSGCRIIARNFSCHLGEIDIIARQGPTLIFVEVKTRTEDDPTPEEQVNHEKQQRLSRLATYYLSRFGTPQPKARMDVIGVVWSKRGPHIRHTPDAFALSST
jgi:putative endonuclease